MALFPHTKYLTLHGVGAPPPDGDAVDRPFWLSLHAFERLMVRLAETEAAHGVSIRITADDGFVSDYEHVMPRLVGLGRTGHFFPVGCRIGTSGCLSASQLREMAGVGMQIGSHGDRHLNWRQVDDRALATDLSASKNRLEAIIGRAVTCVSVPYGAVDPRVAAFARAAGYTHIFTSSRGFATAAAGLIPRTTVKATFDTDTDLDRLVGRPARLHSAVIDRLRRWRYAVSR